MSAEPQRIGKPTARLYNLEAGMSSQKKQETVVGQENTSNSQLSPKNSSRDNDLHPLPNWLKPFLSLRWRLTFVYTATFGIFIILLGVLITYTAEHTSLRNLILIISMITLATIVVGALVASLVSGIMLRPLKEMADTSRAIAAGDFKQRVRLPGGEDEIGRLALSFNEMIDQIEKAFESQRAQERRAHRFISSASHELRTPLTSIRGLTEVLMRGGKDNPEMTQRVLKLMKNESERMTRLVNDMLTLARLDEGRPLQYQAVDLVDIAIEGVEQAKVLAGGNGPHVSLELATEERLIVLGDVDRLKQALFVLFDNAIKYGRALPDGQISLRLNRENDQALMQVIDNGQGIAPEDQPNIFDRFYRGQHIPPYKTDGTPIPGAGLGLSIALAILQAHNGDLSMESNAQGSTFTIHLPCKKA